MNEIELQFQKKRDPAQVVTDSFRFLRNEYKPILKLIAIYVLPFIVLFAWVQVQLQQKYLGELDFSDAEILRESFGRFYSNMLILSVFGVFVMSLLVSVFYSYVEAYIKKGKGNFTLADVTPHLFANGLMALSANLISFILITLGMFLCFVPGIYFANTFSIIVFVYMFERKGLGNAFRRSAQLVNSQWWGTFAINVIAVVLLMAVNFVFSLPAMVANISVGFAGFGPEMVEELPGWYWVVSGISSIVTTILWIVPFTFLAFQYFNLVESLPANREV